MDLEFGSLGNQGALIPQELSMDSFPFSFCYYDMILNFCQEAITENFRSNYKLKNTFRLNHQK